MNFKKRILEILLAPKRLLSTRVMKVDARIVSIEDDVEKPLNYKVAKAVLPEDYSEIYIDPYLLK